MKLSLDWLQRYIDLSDQKPEQVAEFITRRVAEVEQIKKIDSLPDTVIVGEILQAEKHPDADRLQIAQVNTGREKLQIVCGAPNIKAGQKIPVALVGTTLPGDFKIEARKVRGVESRGMLCAEDELGLGDDHTGIMILDETCKVGEKLNKILNIKSDTIIEVENKNITHRPDLFSHRGFARELAVIFRKNFTFPKTPEIKEGKEKLQIITNFPPQGSKSKTQNPVPIYTAIKIDNVQITGSPTWLKRDLENIGIKSINNIVDATNWVMTDCGQPLHAFDGHKVNEIKVRFAKKGEKILTLDHENYDLEENDIIITDGQKPIAIAGIIGGKETAISEKTTSLILESAKFDPTLVRRTSQRLGLRTDALTRFEKALDPCLALEGMKQLTNLILELCPQAKIASQLIKIKDFQETTKKVKFTHEQLEKKIGCRVKESEVKRILETLGFRADKLQIAEDKWQVVFPSFRVTKDTGIFEDIVEEIARHIGYENIKPAAAQVPVSAPIINFEKKYQRQITNILIGAGFSETHNYAFLDGKTLIKCGFPETDAIKILNPLSRECEFLQPCLIPNMLGVVKKNEREFLDKLKFFTFDRRWEPGQETSSKEQAAKGKQKEAGGKLQTPGNIKEIKEILMMIAGKKNGFEIIKGLIEQLLNNFHIDLDQISFRNGPTKYRQLFEPAFYTDVIVSKTVIGKMSRINETTLRKLGIRTQPIFTGKFYLEKLLKIIPTDFHKFHNLPQFPAVKRDFAFVVDEKMLVNNLTEAIKKISNRVESVEIFDIYRDENLPRDKKSVALAVSLRDPGKTLKEEEIGKVTNKILKTIEKIGGQLR